MSRNKRRRRWFHGWYGPGVLAAGNGAMLAFESTNATITPAITLSGDGPCSWEVTESDGVKYYYVANSISHTKTAGGNMTVRLLNTMQVAPYVGSVTFQSDGIISSLEELNLSLFYNVNSNISLNVEPMQLTGGSGITLSGALQTLELQFNGLVSGPRLHMPSAIRTYRIDNNGILQSEVDSFVSFVFANRAFFTYATPTFNIGGTNSTPSGIYQFANPPTTGKEMIYWLVNDPLAEGFNKQTWTYTL